MYPDEFDALFFYAAVQGGICTTGNSMVPRFTNDCEGQA